MSQSEAVYPILCQAVLKSKIWGGRMLERLFGFDLPAGEQVGEAWLAADLKEGCSTVVNGPWAGRTLGEVTAAWGEAMIGSAWEGKPTGGRFPLLVKLLDAQDDLSVQVHPDAEACREHFPEDFSKDESWVVVHAEPGGSILHGFKPHATLEQFDAQLEAGTVTDLMRRVEVEPEQVFRVAPGTVHALCRGVVILEIQEPSDSTFRIYDYGRLGDDGKPRALHLEQARKVMVFGDATPPESQPLEAPHAWGLCETLVDVEAYRIERATLRQAVTWLVDPRSAQVVVSLEGACLLRGADENIALKPGGCAILPAAVGQVELVPEDEKACVVLASAGGVEMLA